MNKKQWIIFVTAIIVISLYGLTVMDPAYRVESFFWTRRGGQVSLIRDVFYFWLFFIVGFFSILFWAARTKNNQ
jgi:hypothetical protein